MKTRFSNKQLVHVFAQENQQYGNGSNLFFEDNILYSYGHHFILAKFVQTEERGIYSRAVFVNSNDYSKTTAKHRSLLRGAFPNYLPVFYLPFKSNRSFELEDLKDIRENLINNIKDLLSKQLKAKTSNFKFLHAQSIFDKVNNLAKLFPSYCEPLESTLFENWNEAMYKSIEANIKRLEAERIKEEKARLKDSEKLELWLKNEFNGALYNVPVHLRFSKDKTTIQTTKGANVPSKEAFVLLSKLRKGQDCKGERIGSFTVEENTLDYVRIGCHVIEWKVINQFFNV